MRGIHACESISGVRTVSHFSPLLPKRRASNLGSESVWNGSVMVGQRENNNNKNSPMY